MGTQALSFPRPRTIIAIVLGAFLAFRFGHLAYMNLRPADPLPLAFEDYEPARFEAALASGEPVLVEIYAAWCPTCKAQHEAFTLLAAEGAVPKARGFRVDYDRSPEFLARYRIGGTGLLLSFRNGRETARAGGLVDRQSLRRFLAAEGLL